MTRFVETTVDGRVATVTIDRATRHNSLVPRLLEELLDAIEGLDEEESVRAVVLRTAGPSFSTGGDVRAFYDNQDRLAAYANRTVGRLNDVILALVELSQPVVVAVDGQVTGGSLGLVLASDVVLATDAATVTPYYAVVGFSPDGGWTAMLPDVIGRERTARIILTNATIEPDRAVDWGLFGDVVPADEIDSRTRETAERIASMRSGSVERTKRLLGPPAALENRLASERRTFVEQIQREEAIDGMAAFLE